MTADPRLDVRGGVAGTTVGLDELVTAAGRLGDAGEVLGEVVVRLAAAGAELGVGSPLSPATGARAEVELVLAARSVAVEAAGVAGLATAVRTAAWAYRVVEEEVTRTSAAAQDAVMAVAGYGAPTLVVGVVALEAVGVDVVAVLDRLVWQAPEVADLAGGTEGLVDGLESNPLTAPFVGPPGAAAGDRSSPGAGAVRPPDADEAAVRVLVDSAAAWGLLRDEGDVRVTPVDDVAGAAPAPGSGHEVPLGSGPRAGSARAPTGLADLAGDEAALPQDGRVRVVEVRTDQGSAWIVEIAGTQVWDPRAGATPFDITTDARSMAAESTLLAAGVQRALAAAQSQSAPTASGIRSGRNDPVLLSGHSLGGIVAAGLASSAEFRSVHRVTHVVALGSPIGKVPVPAEVQVLAVEHRQDPVPRLEGRVNPDRSSWVTVSRDLSGGPHPEGRASAAHRAERYVETARAIDASDNRSVTAWRAGAGRFFPDPGEGASVVVRDYRIARVEAPP